MTFDQKYDIIIGIVEAPRLEVFFIFANLKGHKMHSSMLFGLYAQLHKEFLKAKLFNTGCEDKSIDNIKQIYDDLERKYKGKPLREWANNDLKKAVSLVKQLSCYYAGINVAEKIVQKILGTYE